MKGRICCTAGVRLQFQTSTRQPDGCPDEAAEVCCSILLAAGTKISVNEPSVCILNMLYMEKLNLRQCASGKRDLLVGFETQKRCPFGGMVDVLFLCDGIC